MNGSGRARGALGGSRAGEGGRSFAEMFSQKRDVCGAVIAWLLCVILYGWTASGGARLTAAGETWPHYHYLVEGFLSGHPYLSLEPRAELLALENPRDPAANQAYRLHDASLYRGRYYLYFGPTPALLLLLPWKVITGNHLPLWIAAAIFAGAGLAAAAGLLVQVKRRYFPEAGAAAIFCAIVVLGHVSWLPVLLRRPGLWEVPIAAALALGWWALWFLWRFHRSGGRTRWAVAGGMALALALGARPTYLFGAGAMVLLFAMVRTGAGWRFSLRSLLAAGTPFAAAIGLWLAYNYVRFDSVLDFGLKHQLTGLDERQLQHFAPRFIAFNAWLYFFGFPELSVYFPFVRTVWVASAPAGYLTVDEMHGIVFAVPVLAAGIWTLVWVGRKRGSAEAAPLAMLVLAGGALSACAAGLLFCFAAACSRYIAELMAGWSVVMGVGILIAAQARGRLRGWAMLGASAAALWSCGYAWLASFEHHGLARMAHPKFYPMVARALNWPSQWTAQRTGQRFGAIHLRIHVGAVPANGRAVLLAAGRNGMLNRLDLLGTAGGGVRLQFVANNQVVLQSRELAVVGERLEVVCHAPWFYPPREHPYWDDVAERQRDVRQMLFSIECGEQSFSVFSGNVFDATRFDPFVRTREASGAAWTWVEEWSRSERSSKFER